tara:strand:- start:1977 stop:3548 length:1572 start_codon:yes stop_codon:yes gene_type:complete
MSDVRINTRSPYYIEANPTAPDPVVIPDPIEENTPPTVTIVATNTTPFVGETVTLTAVATDSDGTITNYLWGGGSSPEVTVSIDVTSSTVLSRTYYVIVTDDDGDTANASITINWQEIPSLTENEDLDINCGDIVNEGSFVGIKTYNLVGVGDKVGTVEIEFLDSGGSQDVPVKFDITWNGTTQTTGYIGDAEGGGSDPIPSPDNTASPTNKKNPTTLTINKTSSAPTQVTLTADPLFPNDTYKFKLNCPDTEATQTFFHTLTGTCTSGNTTFTYTDVNGVTQTVILANGEKQLVSAQDGTVATSVCTGDTDKGGESFDLGTPEQELAKTTEFNFWLDNSGSMSSDSAQIASMTQNELKNTFLNYYEDDNVLYNERIIINEETSERFLSFSAASATSPTATKIVNLSYLDESTIYHTTTVGDNSVTSLFNADLANLRSVLDSQVNFGDHLAIVFCIEKTTSSKFISFSNFIDNISTGINGFDGSNGLSDRSEVIFVRNVLPNQNSTYYHQVTVQALQDLGYNI